MSIEDSNNQWLPKFPTIAVRVLEMLADDSIAMVEMAKEIKVDPILSARILQVANSPMFQSRSEITTLEHAISWLGKSEVAGLVLSFKLSTYATENCCEPRHFNDFWRQSFIQGCAMSRIAETCGQIRQGEAYICGLLMDFGRLLLLDGYPSGYGKIIDESQAHGRALHILELEQLGLTHATVGQEVLSNMNLPERFGQVAALHTMTTRELVEHSENPDFKLIAAGVASSSMADFFCRNNQGNSLATVESICRTYLHMGERDIQWVLDSVRTDINEKAGVFAVDVEGMLPIGQLIGHANCQIGKQAKTSEQTTNQDEAYKLEQENRILRELVSILEEKVCKDEMTGIYNRDYFIGQFHERINCNEIADDSFAIMMIDIDNFKSINDEHGHLAGDFAITWTAGRINAFFDSGLVARYGGDEFVVIAEINDEETLQNHLQKLCDEVRDQSPQATERDSPITISAGAVVCDVDEPHESLPARIFEMADLAMYEAKRSGGNCGHVVSLTEVPQRQPDGDDAGSSDTTPVIVEPAPDARPNNQPQSA